jgi:hypothetical protein
MRKTILAVLSVVAASVAGCTHFCPSPAHTEQFSNPCLSKGVVCIDPKSQHPSQKSVHIHGGDIAHFFITDGDGVLTIAYAPTPAIEYVRQEGSHVWVKTNPVKVVVHVEYTIEIKGRRSLDPEMVIEP